MNCEHCKLPREGLHDCMASLMAEVLQLRGTLSLAEEGLANYAQQLTRAQSVNAEFHNIDDVAEIRRLRLQVEALALLLYGPAVPQPREQE
jgi:hypothetical protein